MAMLKSKKCKMEKKCLKKITLIYRYFGVEISFYTSLGVWMPKAEAHVVH